MIADDLQHLAQPVSALKPLPENPRKGDVEAVARSYERFGQRKPIVAKRDGTVIDGNHQLLAAKKLGWAEIAVVFTDDDDLTAKAYALAANRTADLGTYDDEFLSAMIKEVAIDPALFSSTGWDLPALDLLIENSETLSSGAADENATIDHGSLLNIVDLTLGEPKTEVHNGDVFLIDNKHWLLIFDVFREHSLWISYLEDNEDLLFLPYPEPMITLTAAAEEKKFVMVQPNLYLAGHLLDRHIAARGKKSVVKK